MLIWFSMDPKSFYINSMMCKDDRYTNIAVHWWIDNFTQPSSLSTVVYGKSLLLSVHSKVLFICIFSITRVWWFIRLCKSTWGHCSIYNRKLPSGFSYRRLYLQLDEGSLSFNANPEEVTLYQTSKIFCPINAHYLMCVWSGTIIWLQNHAFSIFSVT